MQLKKYMDKLEFYKFELKKNKQPTLIRVSSGCHFWCCARRVEAHIYYGELVQNLKFEIRKLVQDESK